MKITIVNGDDWEGIYVDGVLKSEGHHVYALEALEVVRDTGRVIAEVERLNADLDWLSEMGYLPESLDEVKLES